MYHIVKTKSKKFQVVLISENGKVLSSTEEFTRKQNAFKNVSAQIEAIDGSWCLCQDDTTFTVHKVYCNGSYNPTTIGPKPKYIPGKNPKKKK